MGEPVSGGPSSHQHRPWESGKNFTRTSASEGVVGSPTSLVEIFDTAFGSEVDQPTDDCIGKSMYIILKSGFNFVHIGGLIFLNHINGRCSAKLQIVYVPTLSLRPFKE